MGSCASIGGKAVSPDGKYLSATERNRRASITHQQSLVQEFTKQAKIANPENTTNNVTGIRSTRMNTFKIGRAHESLQALSLDSKLRSIPPKDMSDTSHIYDVLQKHWIFRETDDDALLSIIENIYNIKIERGTEIITQGDDGDAFYIVASGECHVIVDGKQKDFVLKKDDTFGELALFFNCARTATIKAATSCVLWKMESIAMKISLMQYHEKVEAKNVTFLERLPEIQPYKGSNEVKRLAQILAPMVFGDGDEIITQGDVGNLFYILEEGECKVIIDGKEKDEHLVSGQWFGEAAIIMSQPRSATVVAIGECKCLALERQNFLEVLEPFEALSASIRDSPVLKSVAHKTKQVYHVEMDRYDLLCVLGVGGFGIITLQREHNDTTERFVAVKEMKKQLVVERNMQRAIGRELEYLTSIQSPFVLEVFATSRDANSIYIITEFLPGGDFFDYLASNGKLNEVTHVKFFIASVLLALQATHKQYIVYRDLKLENLVIDSIGYIKLIDFGLAKRILNRSFTICGTPRYCSPEMLTGTGHNQATDFWSLGVLLFECLYGASPFNDNCSELELFRRVTRGTYQINDKVKVSVECHDMISSLLQKKPKDRIGGIGMNGAGLILKHKWFHKFDIDALKCRRMAPPDGSPKAFNLETHPFPSFDISGQNRLKCYNPDHDKCNGWDEVF